MNITDFSKLTSKTIDKETILFGDTYCSEIGEFALLSNSDIISLYSSILIENDLSDFQKSILSKLFIAFDTIQNEIDPNKLQKFKNVISDELELCFYRNSEKGITNLIIDEDQLITFSYISKTNQEDNIIEFYEGEEYSIEKIAYSFFSF